MTKMDEIEPQKGVCICGHGWKSHRFPTSYPDCYDHACLGLFTPQDENGCPMVSNVRSRNE